MSHETLKKSLHDVAFTLTTPFDEETGDVLYDKLAENVRTLNDRGARLFIPCGNTAEYYSLTRDERVRIVETVVDEVGSEETVIAGAGGSTRTVIDLIRSYEDVGVDGAMIMYPSHTYAHQEGVVDYYLKIVDSTDLPLVPYKRGSVVSNKTLVELSTVTNIVGVKYAVNDVSGFSRVTSEAQGDIEWVNGIAERFAPTYALEGAVGFTTGIGNALPKVSLALYDALDDEDWRRAKELRDVLRPLEDLRAETGKKNELEAANNVPVVKFCMDLAGLYGGPVREPVVSLSESDKERARKYFNSAKQVTTRVSSQSE